MDDQQLLTPSDVAERLQLSIYTILDYLRHGHPRGGKLRGVKFGKQWRIREADLQAFIEEHLSNGDRRPTPHPVLVPPVAQALDVEPEAHPHQTPDLMDPQQRKAALLTRIRALKAQGRSLQAIAHQLNAEGVPTISGRGRWQAGTIGNMLKEVEAP
jgi:excisionase family DNA binding protein